MAKLRGLAESDPAYRDILDLLPKPATGPEDVDQEVTEVPGSAAERDGKGVFGADG